MAKIAGVFCTKFVVLIVETIEPLSGFHERKLAAEGDFLAFMPPISIATRCVRVVAGTEQASVQTGRTSATVELQAAIFLAHFSLQTSLGRNDSKAGLFAIGQNFAGLPPFL